MRVLHEMKPIKAGRVHIAGVKHHEEALASAVTGEIIPSSAHKKPSCET